jgi:plasmid stabilization system protein ParE
LTYSIRFSPLAEKDKKDIKMYLSKYYSETPRRFTALLKERIANLKDNPYLYPEHPDNTNYRRMLVGNYVVFYKVNDLEKQNDIYRILRASWDLPKHL